MDTEIDKWTYKWTLKRTRKWVNRNGGAAVFQNEKAANAVKMFAQGTLSEQRIATGKVLNERLQRRSSDVSRRTRLRRR